MSDISFMQRCVQLALLGAGRVAPNPMVGAVLVHDGKIIGEGYHEYFGGPHAEVNCIAGVPDNKKELIGRSKLFVSLEPCNHFGKTPPCTDLILRNNIHEVTIGCVDKNSVVSGKGIQRLKDGGVKVETGILEKACMSLNRRFFTSQIHKRPYIILKWAQTANGVIGDRKKRIHISNAYTNTLVQRWRSEEHAILIGSRTAVADDPLLTNRYGSGRQPLRIVLSGKPPGKDLKMFVQPGSTVVFNTERDENLEHVHWRRVSVTDYLTEVMYVLHEMDIQSILVEGGAFTLQQFIDAGLWDECRVITNTAMVVQGDVGAPLLGEIEPFATQTLLDDFIRYFSNPQNIFVAHKDLSDYF